MATTRLSYERALYWYQQERQWFAEHGGDPDTGEGLEAYVARYGSKDDPEHYGDGGEAIYEADKAALERKGAEYLDALHRHQKRLQKRPEAR